jgi:hypothetical protein
MTKATRTINLHHLGDGIRPRLVGTVQPKRSANLSDILHLPLENRVLTFTGVITHDAGDARWRPKTLLKQFVIGQRYSSAAEPERNKPRAGSVARLL